MKKKPINIALIGISKQGQLVYKFFFDKNFPDKCSLAALSNANAVITEYDLSFASKQWQKLFDTSQVPSILIAKENPEIANTIWLEKPFSVDKLKMAIVNLIQLIEAPIIPTVKSSSFKELASTPVEKIALTEIPSEAENKQAIERKPCDITKCKLPTAKNIETATNSADKSEDRSVSTAYAGAINKESLSSIDNHDSYKDSAYLEEKVTPIKKVRGGMKAKTFLSLVSNAVDIARNNDCIAKINGLHEPILIMPGGDKVITKINDKTIYYMSGIPLQTKMKITKHTAHSDDCEQRCVASEKYNKSTDVFLWQIALDSFRGKLPENIDVEQPIKMSSWPNLSRLKIIPHVMPIAALWTRRSLSPAQVSKILNISETDVFRFVFAANALDQFVIDENPNIEPHNGWKKSRDVFKSIIRSFQVAS